MDPITLLAALGPLAVDLGKSLINRFIATDTFKPSNIDDYLKMKQLDLEMFKAMNDVGNVQPSYPWVEAITRLMRPVVGIIVLGVWAVLELTNNQSPTASNFAGAVGFWLFGDRTLFYANKSTK